jgi:hypothetical protein
MLAGALVILMIPALPLRKVVASQAAGAGTGEKGGPPAKVVTREAAD